MVGFPAEREACAAQRRGIGGCVSAVQFEYPPGNRQAKAVATRRAVARTIKSSKSREDVFALLGRDADPVVVDVDAYFVASQFGVD